jgi:tRNA 2-thiouridine synthesizing protein A
LTATLRAPVEIDARGLKCPLPVLKAEKQLAAMAPGAQLVLIADDPVARIDIPLMCRKAGHDCLIDETGNAWRFTIMISEG